MAGVNAVCGSVISFLATAILLGPILVRGADEKARARRPVVAVLFLEDRTGDPRYAAWRATANYILSEKLAAAQAIRVARHDPVRRAFKKTGLRPGAPLDPPGVRIMGEYLEAQRVVWGSYERDGPRWKVAVRVLNVAAGSPSREIVAAAEDWFDACTALALDILQEIGVDPSAEERSRMDRRWTSSAQALESLAAVHLARMSEEPFDVQESHARKALEADPACARAHEVAGALAGTQGRSVEAEASAREAAKLNPASASGHGILGIVLAHRKAAGEAVAELREAHRLDPDEAEWLNGLASIELMQGKSAEALEHLEEAAALDPTNASTQALIGRVRLEARDRAQALQALQEAERLYLGDGGNAAQMLFVAYCEARDVAKALRYYDEFDSWAQGMGTVNPEALRDFARVAELLRARLTPVTVAAAMPREYAPGELDAALRERLSEDDLRHAVNPLAGGPLLKERARRVMDAAKDDMGRARALFDALVARLDRRGERRLRTALEAVLAWESPEERFVCDDHAKLYVALAREAGLKAFYTLVEKDPEGHTVSHACAALFIEEKVYLVDVTYRWFGAPHQVFHVLDDLRTLAVHHTQWITPDIPDRTRSRIATRLWPESALCWYALASALVEWEDWAGAREAAAKGAEIAPEHWLAYTVKGVLAIHEGELGRALNSFRIAAAMNDRDPQTHYHLGKTLARLGKLEEALEAFRAVLRCDPLSDEAGKATRYIAQIQEHLTSPEHFGDLKSRVKDLERLELGR